MVSDDSQVLLIVRDVGDGSTHTRQHLVVLRLEQTDDELETAHEAAHHLARVLVVLDARTDRPGRAGLYVWVLVFQERPQQSHAVQFVDDSVKTSGILRFS